MEPTITKPRRLVTALALAAVLGLGGCEEGPTVLAPAPELELRGSSPKFTDVSFEEAICAQHPGEVEVKGSMLHLRGFRNENVAVSSDPRYTGTATHEFSAHINLNTGKGIVRGRLTFQPDGIAGTWEGTLRADLEGGLSSGRVSARGTGALRGQTLLGEFEQVFVDPAERLCPPPGIPSTHFVGPIRIIDPGV